MASLPDIWNKYRKWCRLVMLLHEGGETVCKDILDKLGVTDITDGGELYRKLEIHKTKIKKLAPYQQKILLPYSKVIDKTKLDVSLNTHIIAILDTAKTYPLIGKLRDKRNELFHMPDSKRNMAEQQFKDDWDEISQLLIKLGCSLNFLNGLKTDDHLSEELEKRLKGTERFYPYVSVSLFVKLENE